MADLFEDEKIKLRSIERVSALFDSEKVRKEIEIFQRFEVGKSNASFYAELINSRKENDLIFINDKLERMYRVLDSHPLFSKFFKKPLEDEKKKSAISELNPYGILRKKLIQDLGEIIQELSGLVTVLWHYVELDQVETKKLIEVITEGQSKEMIESGDKIIIPWGAAKGDRAFLMSMEGKTDEEIAIELGIEKKSVSAYKKRGRERAERLGITSESNQVANSSEELEVSS